MKIYLRDRNSHMVDAWLKHMHAIPDVKISLGDIFDGSLCDAIVSPANSFGFMDGGIDAVYSERWPHLQKDLQDELAKNHYGEIPVGSALIVPIHKNGHKAGDFKWLIQAPTMRIPADIRGTVNAYLAFRATLIAVEKHNKENPTEQIKSILCPGLGTAVGRLDHDVAAVQMLLAWQAIYGDGDKPCEFGDLSIAWHQHEVLVKGSL